ncbi:hypothetical protein MRB53_027912 [Persea americana]|uniref:Uncharacterized protein n=1 Tax=Persea americana TaxID=3435 RepID=A0ACC2KE82_PERAE|nr:hypothetical protein MRB53_027912 [Persea americana]
MATTKSFFKFLLFFSQYLLKRLRNPHLFHVKTNAHTPTSQLQNCPPLLPLHLLSNQTLLFHVEDSLLRSSSPFPYFMLVAFEAGGLLRALLLLLLHPLLCCVGEEMALKVMVMVSFCGVREEGFRVGRAVLPKFFLEDVGLEGFEVLVRAGRRVGVSELPRVMVEGFLKEYLEVEAVVGRELKVVGGFYVGLMEEKKVGLAVEELLGDGMLGGGGVVGFGSCNRCLDQHPFSLCKEIYLVTEADRRSYHSLLGHRYPKPLIFHDGRLAFRPTPLATLAMFMWVPFGLFLAIFRALVWLLLSPKVAIPILSFSGMRLRIKRPSTSPIPNKQDPKNILYVCNHRTLLDPVYLSAIVDRPLTAVTYSLSRLSEILAPIKTVRLTREREEDKKSMEKLLSQGDLAVCPEGTTCREPFLLRFSPLFAELNKDIVPVALDAHVSMFYGTTAGGLKCLDPVFFLMNPFPAYDVELLEKVAEECLCGGVGGKSRYEVANHVQEEIGRALGFECTTLTRRDKYLILAGNEGIVPTDHKTKRK